MALELLLGRLKGDSPSFLGRNPTPVEILAHHLEAGALGRGPTMRELILLRHLGTERLGSALSRPAAALRSEPVTRELPSTRPAQSGNSSGPGNAAVACPKT